MQRTTTKRATLKRGRTGSPKRGITAKRSTTRSASSRGKAGAKTMRFHKKTGKLVSAAYAAKHPDMVQRRRVGAAAASR